MVITDDKNVRIYIHVLLIYNKNNQNEGGNLDGKLQI